MGICVRVSGVRMRTMTELFNHMGMLAMLAFSPSRGRGTPAQPARIMGVCELG